jgi:CheY-like chemotaxis protein
MLLPGWRVARSQGERIPQPALQVGDGQCVLVIDDERSVREVTAATLEAFGYRALVAGSGQVGVELCAHRVDEIQLVVTDMVMPGMDGRDTIAALKKINPALKIIAISGIMDRSKITGGAELLIDGFLSKPFTAEALLTTMGNVLKVAGQRPPT